MWFIGVEVEQETSAPPPQKNPGSAPETQITNFTLVQSYTKTNGIQACPLAKQLSHFAGLRPLLVCLIE